MAVLQAASVAGPEFAAHALAGVAPSGSELADVEYVEHRCDALVGRQGILRAAGETAWPDGRTSARYRFVHALYQDVIYQGLPSSTRRRLHQAIGERLEHVHDRRTTPVASELAVHFEQGRNIKRAVHCRRQAAEHALGQKVVLCSPLTLYAVLAVVRQAADAAALERTSGEVLAVLGTFTQEWDRFCEALDKVGRAVDGMERAYGELAGTRRRALERPLARIDDLRRSGADDAPERLRVVP